MQKRHFVAIAATLRSQRPGASLERHAWERMCDAFAAMCAREYRGHASFNRERFLAACGVEN